MKRTAFVFLLFIIGCGPPQARDLETTVRLEIRTELGNILLEVYPETAPGTVSNFLRYVDEGFFEGGSFHRTVHSENQPNDSVRITVIQGDIDRARSADRYPPILLERTNLTGVLHVDGAISMARGGPDSAMSSFFICIGDQPELDFGGRRNPDGQGFAAFGAVVRGMEVVRAINQSPADGQSLSPTITIHGISRVEG